MLGSPTDTIMDVLVTPRIFTIENPNESLPVFTDSRTSSTFFKYVFPAPFSLMFRAGFKTNVLDGSLNFGPILTTQMNFLKRGWSLATPSEANAALNANSYMVGGKTLLSDTNSGQVSTYQLTNGQFVLKYQLPSSPSLLVKSSIPLSTIPNVSDIIDLSIVLGRIGNIIPQSLTDGIVPEVLPPSTSTTPKAITNNTNKNVKDDHFKELVIYISVGLMGTVMIVMATFFWMQRESSPHIPQQ